MTKNIKLQQRSLMRLVVIFSVFLPFFCYGRVNPLYYQKMTDEKKQNSQSAQEEDSADLESITEELQKDMKSLLFTLTHEQTGEEKKLEIIKTLSETALLNNKVEDALRKLVARGRKCENEEDQTGCLILDMVTLKAHTELIRRKTDSLTRLDQENRDYYKDMVLDGVLIITGAGLLFIPVGGPAFTTALFTMRFATMGKAVGSSVVTGIGLYRVGREVVGGEDEDLKNVFELVKDVTATNILTKAIVHFAQIGDKELMEGIVLSSSESEAIDFLYRVIEDSSYSSETSSVAIEALLAFPEELQERRTKTIGLLTELADKNKEQLDLRVRISAVKVLGKIGERVPEVAEYLAEKGKGRSEEQSKETEFAETEGEKEVEDELRLIALVQSGRNKAYFDNSIEELDDWIEKNSKDDNKTFLNSLNIKLEIPKAFINFLLSAKEDRVKVGEKASEKLHQHIIVLREFILSEIIDIETKLKFSKILIHWTESFSESMKIKEFLRKIWTNPAEDIGLYLKQFQEKKPTQENKPAFEFLQSRIEFLKGIKSSDILREIVQDHIQSIIDDFEKAYPKQKEISEKFKVFIADYTKMLENIKI